MSARPRLHYLDNLRAFVIILVIVLHAAITYMSAPPTWWYVIDSDRSVVFTWLVLLVDVPIMQVLFFVAGYFAVGSLQRRGPLGFIREKVVRLAIPWVLGVVFLAPLETYMTYVSRANPTGYLQFWTSDFWGPMFQQSVYWFLGVLFVEFLVLVYAYVLPARHLLQAPESPRRTAAPEPLPLVHRAHDRRVAPVLTGLEPRRLAFDLVPVGHPAGPDRLLRGLLHARGLRRAARLVRPDRLPASPRPVGRRLRAGRPRLPGVPECRPGPEPACPGARVAPLQHLLPHRAPGRHRPLQALGRRRRACLGDARCELIRHLLRSPADPLSAGVR